MSKEDYSKYYEVLELGTEASWSDIRGAYLHLKELYSTDSIVTFPLMYDFPDEKRTEILSKIEEAYTQLKELFDNRRDEDEQEEELVSADELKEEIAKIESFSGRSLKQLREKAGIELYDIALATKIRTVYLENIEMEKFDALPPEVYTRGFVMDYARYLSLDAKRVADEYMSRYRSWKKTKEEEF